MPLFATLADMQARFEERQLIQLTDEAGVGAIEPAKIDQVLGSADTLIIGYVAARHRDTAAFSGHPTLTDVACDYAMALLWKGDLPEWLKDRRKQAIATLTAIADGKIKLDQGEETAAPRPGQILTSGSDRKFGRDNLGGY